MEIMEKRKCISSFYPSVFKALLSPNPEKSRLCGKGLLNIYSKVGFQSYSITKLQGILTLSPTTSFRLFQTERVCRRQL